MSDDSATFAIEGLRVAVEDKEILKGVDLTLNKGEVHVLMGPNGSGKSTLAHALMGHPKYKVNSGDIYLNGESLLDLPPDQRARKGLFMAFQYPREIPGVKLVNFLRQAYGAVRGEEPSVMAFYRLLQAKMAELEMDEAFSNRYVNEGFSGGEKKRNEVLQLSLLEPQVAVLDETDSGLDIDALKVVAQGIERMRGPDIAFLIITHYQRILNYVKPDFVHIILDGRIVRSGSEELARILEEKGYEWLREEQAALSGGSPHGQP